MHISDIPDAVRREATEYVDKTSTPDAELREYLINAVRFAMLADRWQSRPMARKSCNMTSREAVRAGTMVRTLGLCSLRCVGEPMTMLSAEISAGIRRPDGSPVEYFFTAEELLQEERAAVEARARRCRSVVGGAA